MNKPEEISKLWDLQVIAGGVTCVRDICHYLLKGQLEEALKVRSHDGDKTRSHPEVEEQLIKMFGCRSHAKQNCKKFPCVPLD